MIDKRPIQSPEDFAMAMSSVKSAIELLSMFDWAQLVEQIAFFEGAGTMIDVGMYKQMLDDPQWEQKKQLFRAADQFTRTLEDIKGQLSNDG